MDIFTIAELAVRLKISKKSAYNWANAFSEFLSVDPFDPLGNQKYRNQATKRTYDHLDALTLAHVQTLRSKNYTIREIKADLARRQATLAAQVIEQPQAAPPQTVIVKIAPVSEPQPTPQTPLEPPQAPAERQTPVIIDQPAIKAKPVFRPLYSPGTELPDLLGQAIPGSATALSAEPLLIVETIPLPVKILQFTAPVTPPSAAPLAEQPIPLSSELIALIRAEPDLRRIAWNHHFDHSDLWTTVRRLDPQRRLGWYP